MSETYTARDGTMWASYDVWWNVNGRDEARARHNERAQELLRKAEELMADEDRFREMGFGVCQFYVDLANLHLRIRDLL